MSELWDALIELDRALPVWRYVATAGGSIGLYRIVQRLWRSLHSRQKPFRCGPFVWKRNEEGDVYAGLRAAKYDYPIWSTGGGGSKTIHQPQRSKLKTRKTPEKTNPPQTRPAATAR